MPHPIDEKPANARRGENSKQSEGRDAPDKKDVEPGSDADSDSEALGTKSDLTEGSAA